jgi:hypothetical protein
MQSHNMSLKSMEAPSPSEGGDHSSSCRTSLLARDSVSAGDRISRLLTPTVGYSTAAHRPVVPSIARNTPDPRNPCFDVPLAAAEWGQALLDSVKLGPMAQQCAICGGPSNSREHVFPTWFLQLWDDTGPFTFRISGKPLRTRAGAIKTSPKLWRTMLACCTICNGDLDRLFEKPAKDPVRRLMRDMQSINDHAEVENVARWAIKTLLLASHPEADQTAFASPADDERDDPWDDYPRGVLRSIRVGTVPVDTSLWFALTDPARPGLLDPPFEDVVLRRTSRPDDLGGSGQARTTGFGLADGRIAWFQLAYHPLHDFEHPFERHGLVTRLWPNPPRCLEVRDHPVLDHQTRLAQVFVDGRFCHGLGHGQRSNGYGVPLD